MTPDALTALAGIVGSANLLTGDDLAPALTDWRGRYRGAARCLVRPASTAEVAATVRLCAEAGIPMLPQGGNTSLCGGATPEPDGESIIIGLGRLNRIRAIDAANHTLTAEAGCTLLAVQTAAAAAGRLFPLSLAAEGSCQIGGNLSTNAGGVHVLRYGNMRELTLGLEVVLPDGQIWNGLRGLKKDNTGYDLKQLFIGAEGSLGIITAAVLKLFPQPAVRVTAWISLDSPATALRLLGEGQALFDARLTAFELLSQASLELVLRHFPGMLRPTAASPWHVLCELSGAQADALDSRVPGWLEDALARKLIQDAAIAQSSVQAEKLWRLRESLSEAQKIDGISLKHDISVPISRIPEFLARADAALTQAFPGIRIIAFGHLGDGNLHYNLSCPDPQKNAEVVLQQETVNRIVYDLVDALDGSLSAEHGLGQLKRELIRHYKTPLEMQLMARIKTAIDPGNLMNRRGER